MPRSPRQLATLLSLAISLPATAFAETEGSGDAVEAIDLLLLPNTRTAALSCHFPALSVTVRISLQ